MVTLITLGEALLEPRDPTRIEQEEFQVVGLQIGDRQPVAERRAACDLLPRSAARVGASCVSDVDPE